MTKVINCYQTPSSRQSQTKRLNLKCFNIGLSALILSLGVFYLVNVSDLAVKGFALEELKTQVNTLTSEKLDNEEAINNLQSYDSLSSRTQKLNMVAIGEIDYLSVPSAIVARK
jgi:cell division protein FtsB